MDDAAKIRQIMELARHSPTAIQMLEEAAGYGTRMVFDSTLKKGDSVRARFVFDDNQVNLSREYEIHELFSHAVHEARHSVQFHRWGLRAGSQMMPADMIHTTWIMEADANAFQAQCAYELYYSNKLERLVANTAWTEFGMDRTHIARFYEKAAEEDGRNVLNGKALAHAFLGFYQDFGTRSVYAENTLNLIGNMSTAQARSLCNFRDDLSPTKIAQQLEFRDVAYIQEHCPKLNLDDLFYAALLTPQYQQLQRFGKVIYGECELPTGFMPPELPKEFEALTDGMELVRGVKFFFNNLAAMVLGEEFDPNKKPPKKGHKKGNGASPQ